MYDFQSMLFRTAEQWGALSGCVVAGVGLLCTMQGFRFAKLLTALACGAGGFVAGSIAAGALGVDPLAVGGGAGVLLGALPFWKIRAGAAASACLTFAALAYYLGYQLDLRGQDLLLTTGVGAAAGISMLWVCPRSLLILLTVLQGGPLIVVGVIGIMADASPGLAATIVSTSNSYALLMPVLLVMLAVMGFSVQLNAKQGDISAGGSAHATDLTPTA